MSMTFADLQSEVKRRATRDQSGSNYDVAVRNLINASFLRISNETPWRPLRRDASFDTVAEFNTGTVSVGVASKDLTFVGADLITNGVVPGRHIKIDTGTRTIFEIATITGENTATLDRVYDGTTAVSGAGFTIFGQEVYNLPIQTGRLGMLWHEGWGYPFAMEYITKRAFMESGASWDDSDTPYAYWMWGEDWAIEQPRQASVVTVSSSSTADTLNVTVFGTVNSYPDYEIIGVAGTAATNGLKSFSKIERVVKSASSAGRITLTTNSAQETVAVIPVGDTTGGVKYKKVQVYPAPNSVYKVNSVYYKEPYRLVNDSDIHELGADFDELIILLATSKLDGEQSKKDVETFASLFANELKVLRRKNADKLDYLPRRGRPSESFQKGSRHSRVTANLSYSQAGSKYGPAGWYSG